jgi:hypothetical protein
MNSYDSSSSNEYVFVEPSGSNQTTQNLYGFNQDNLFEPGCSGLLPCAEIKNFMKLICTPYDYNTGTYLPEESLDKDAILSYLNTDFYQKFLNELLIKYNHDCCIFNYISVRMDAYEFLMENNIITVDGTDNTLSMKQILYCLFLDVCSKKNIPRQKSYINYFWTKLMSIDQKIITDYRYNHCYSYVHAILNAHHQNIAKEYFHEFLKVWDSYYPEQELPNPPQQNELVDNLTIYLQLARLFMIKELEILFSRKSYDPKYYEWRFTSGANNMTFSVPIISYVLEEFAKSSDERNLKKIAKLLRVFIENGKINFDQEVIENGATVMDYLNQYQYNYNNSPVMAVFKDYTLKPAKNVNILQKYNSDPNIPYSEIWNKYQYMKDPSYAHQIIDECMNEELRTGHCSYEFLKTSGLIFITSMLINDESNWNDGV